MSYIKTIFILGLIGIKRLDFNIKNKIDNIINPKFKFN